MKFLLPFLILFLSCSERSISIPIDSEVRSIRSEPPLCIYITFNLDGKVLLEGTEVTLEELKTALRSCYNRAGESFRVILTADKRNKVKNLYKIFTTAAEAKLKKFSFVVEEKNKFKNFRNFQIISEVDFKKMVKEKGEVFFTDSSQTVQEIVYSISANIRNLPDDLYYNYYVVYKE